MVVGFVFSVAEDLGKRPLARVHGGFREEKDVWGVKVYQCDHIRQRGAVVFRVFFVDCEGVYLCRGWGCRWRGRVRVGPQWSGVWRI